MMTIGEMCEALDAGRMPLPPYYMEILYPEGEETPEPEGMISFLQPNPAKLTMLKARDLAGARAEARGQWNRLDDPDAEGYLVYQSDWVVVHGLNLNEFGDANEDDDRQPDFFLVGT